MLKLDLPPCIPPIWAHGGHVQTVLGHLLPSPMLENKGESWFIDLPDGDRLVAFYLKGTTNTIVYLFHGLAGSTDSTYIHRMARIAQAQGHSVIMTNHRGCGEGVGLAKGPYHSGRAEDLSSVLDFGKRKFPQHKHLAIGFSLSGNALLLLLSGRRGSTQPDLAIAVNAPIDLKSASVALRQGFNRVYDMKFFRQCRKDILAGPTEDAIKRRIPRFTTLFELDELYTAPAGGFKDRNDYYTSCSTWDLLDQIKTPTLILTAYDDPFVAGHRYAEAKISKNVHMHIEKYGGHMGYITKHRTPLGNSRWMDYAIHQGILELVGRF